MSKFIYRFLRAGLTAAILLTCGRLGAQTADTSALPGGLGFCAHFRFEPDGDTELFFRRNFPSFSGAFALVVSATGCLPARQLKEMAFLGIKTEDTVKISFWGSGELEVRTLPAWAGKPLPAPEKISGLDAWPAVTGGSAPLLIINPQRGVMLAGRRDSLEKLVPVLLQQIPASPALKKAQAEKLPMLFYLPQQLLASFSLGNDSGEAYSTLRSLLASITELAVAMDPVRSGRCRIYVTCRDETGALQLGQLIKTFITLVMLPDDPGQREDSVLKEFSAQNQGKEVQVGFTLPPRLLEQFLNSPLLSAGLAP